MPKQNRNLSVTPVPSSPAPVNDRPKLLEAAGLDDARQAELLRCAVDAAESALQATVPVVSPTGGIIEWRPDWFARLTAAKLLVGLLGAAPSKSAGASVAVQTVINVDLPDWAQRMAASTPRAKVIDMPREAGPSETSGVQPGQVGHE